MLSQHRGSATRVKEASPSWDCILRSREAWSQFRVEKDSPASYDGASRPITQVTVPQNVQTCAGFRTAVDLVGGPGVFLNLLDFGSRGQRVSLAYDRIRRLWLRLVSLAYD